MKALVLVFLAVASAYGQPLEFGKPLHTSFENIKSFHFHQNLHNCKGQPDGVYSKWEKIYYGCVNGKDVCSEEPGELPYYLINNYDAAMRQRHAGIQPARARVAPEVSETTPGTALSGWPNLLGVLSGSAPNTGPPPTPAPPPTPPTRIAEEQLLEIPIGTTREEIIQKLGKPFMSILGEVETLTYLLTSGSAAKLELANGKLTQLRIVPAR